MKKRKNLEWTLAALKGFEEPKLHLEQYATSAQMAVDIAQAMDADVSGGLEGKSVVDLGCGCGMLTIATALIGSPAFVLGVDIDDDALKICQDLEEETTIELLRANVLEGLDELITQRFDVAITNPPFGTKNNQGVDTRFVQAGLALLRPGGRLFSLHKTASRDFLLRTAKSWPSVSAKCVAELRWELPATYRHHKKASVDIEVDLICYRRKKSAKS